MTTANGSASLQVFATPAKPRRTLTAMHDGRNTRNTCLMAASEATEDPLPCYDFWLGGPRPAKESRVFSPLLSAHRPRSMFIALLANS